VPPNVFMYVAAWFARTDALVIFSHHIHAGTYFEQSSGYKPLLSKLLMKWFYPRADHLITVSQGVADSLIEIFNLDETRVSIIYNPIVDQDLIRQSKQPVEHSFFDNNDCPIILAAARLHPPKDFETLLVAFNKARQDRRLKLLIIGEGKMRTEIESRITDLSLTDDVSMPGYIDNPYAYMRKSDLFVLSSNREGFGNVVAEALACGVKVVSSDCFCGPAEILEDGKWGKLVPVEDPDALAQAMLDALDEPPRSTLERAMDFTVESAASAYISLLLPE